MTGPRRYQAITWSRYNRIVTATHESGQGVIAIATDRPFAFITIISDARFKGHINYTNSDFFDEVFLLKPQDRVLRTLAGALAQRHFFPRSRWRDSGSSDWKSAGDLFLRRRLGLKGKALKAELHRLSHGAARLVEEHEAEIRSVAEALLEHGTLSEDQVRHVMALPPRVDLDLRWRDYDWPAAPRREVGWERDDL